MRPTTGRAATMLALSAIALLALAGCDGSGSGTSTTTSATQTTSAQAGGGSDDCTGTFDVEKITGTQTVDLDNQQFVLEGEVDGLELTLEEDAWELAGDNAKAMIKLAGVAQADATINGTASGEIVKEGDTYQFALERSEGSATIRLGDIGEQELEMGELAPALAPVGQATVDCTDDGVTIESNNMTLEATRTGGAGTGTSGSSPGSGTSESKTSSMETTTS